MLSHNFLGIKDKNLIFAAAKFYFVVKQKNTEIFGRDLGIKFFINGTKHSNQSSNQDSQRVVRFMRSPYSDRILHFSPLISSHSEFSGPSYVIT